MSDSNRQTSSRRTQEVAEVDAVVVGAGFAGMYMIHRLRGLGLSLRVFEAGDGVGGTWYWNRYPGARCDVESMEYSYQFSQELQQEWQWSERYATQPEILRYANHVADRFDLRRDITFNTRVQAATFDDDCDRWQVETEAGSVSARYCIMATGCLSSANRPDFEGLETFSGDWYHTGLWPHEGVDFRGKRVAVIGTGSSAIQSIPVIAQEADALTVFQRTASFSVPAHNGPLPEEKAAAIKAEYPAFRARNKEMLFGFGSDNPEGLESAIEATPEERQEQFEKRWESSGLLFVGAFRDILLDKQANDLAVTFIHEKIHDIVEDPEVAARLCPDQVVGCKRLCVDTGYYATFNRPNVSLVDVGETPIEEITAKGVRVAGQEYEVDCIVFATGFDAMTGALLKLDVRGRGGLSLQEKWAAGPRTYLGLATAGFPNFFIITGPGSPSVLSNMIPSIEQHVDWISDCLAFLGERKISRIEATIGAEDAWVDHVNELSTTTLFPSCNSWYLGANVPGKPRVFMPYLGFPPYVERCNEVASKDYEGFELGGS
jgi:cation diffusion facilitator CzcD-associated flavoprotein CzcO